MSANPLPLKDIASLRAAIGRIEAGSGLGEAAPEPLELGIPDIDSRLGGGLRRGTLHAIRAPHAGLGLAAFGFALSLLARALKALPKGASGEIALISEESGRREMGRLYAPGLAGFGLDPESVLLIEARDAAEMLIAAEDCLAEPALAGVLIELASPAGMLDRTAARRLLHAAARGRGLGLLVQTGPAALRDDLPLWTRWEAASAGSHPAHPQTALSSAQGAAPLPGPGAPSFRVRLEKNRLGPLGLWALGFAAERADFTLLSLEKATRDTPSHEASSHASSPPEQHVPAAFSRALAPGTAGRTPPPQGGVAA